MIRTGLALLALLAGCTLGPDYRRPTTELPPNWIERTAVANPPAPAAPPLSHAAQVDRALVSPLLPRGAQSLLETAWWARFGDAQLDELVRRAIEDNQDLRLAAFRIEQYDARLQINRSAGWPQVGYSASRSRETLSENRQVPLAVGTRPVDNSYVVSAGASWELDLWGKVRRANEAALADLLATEENRRALMVSLVSDVATGYVRLLSLDSALALLKQNVASLRETLKLSEARYSGGRGIEAEVVQAQAAVFDAQAAVPVKEAEIAVLENALSQLAGRNPGPIERGKTAAELLLPPVPGGLPASLLAQRPDVRKVEQELVAANARIGVAKADYFPQLSLTASSGYASTELGKLTMLSSNFGSLGVSLLGPLFTGGRVSGQVREAEAVQKAAESAFVRAVQTALHEVEDALVQHAKAGEEVQLRERHVGALREQLNLVRKRYEGGYSNYFDVLAADRALSQGLLQHDVARRDQFTSLVGLYKALGGGWGLPVAISATSALASTTNTNEKGP